MPRSTENIRHTIADCQRDLLDDLEYLNKPIKPVYFDVVTHIIAEAAIRRALHAERLCRYMLPLLMKTLDIKESAMVVEEVVKLKGMLDRNED